VSKHISNLISQGEHQQLDFKHSISDSKKIARSLVAFANTDGGTLLIGVKDNGNITGVNSDEEYYMLEGAAQMYCKPEVKFKITRWDINKKVVLEVYVKPDPKNLYKALDKDGKWRVLYRVNDENIEASPLRVKIWKANRYRKSIKLNLSHKDKLVIDYLKQHKKITVDEYSKVAFTSRLDAEKALINLAVLGLVTLKNEMGIEYFAVESNSFSH
jgi:predicted HTH transcriptional regulator